MKNYINSFDPIKNKLCSKLREPDYIAFQAAINVFIERKKNPTLIGNGFPMIIVGFGIDKKKSIDYQINRVFYRIDGCILNTLLSGFGNE